MVPVKKPTKRIGSRHVQALLLFFGNTIAFIIRTCMSVAIIAMTDTKSSDSLTLDWNSNQTSLILSSLLWGCVISQIPMGYLVRKGGSHKLFFYGMFTCSVLSMLTPLLAEKLGWIAVLCCRIVMGLCQGCLTPCLKGLLTNWIPLAERATLGSFVLNGPQMGNVLSMSLSGLLAAHLGWQSIFYAFGISGVIWSILFYIYGSESPSKHQNICEIEKTYIMSSMDRLDDEAENEDYQFPWKAVLTSLPVWSLVLVNVTHIWSYYMLLTEMPTYMKKILHFDIEQSGVIASLPYLAKWLFAFPISWASDFSLRKGAQVTVVRKICNTIGMWGPAFMLLILCLLKTKDQVTAVVILVLAVGSNSALMCGSEINEMDICPNHAAMLASILNTCGKIFGLLAPIACGFIVPDQTNEDQWYTVFYISVTLYLFGNLAFIIFGTAEIQSWNEHNSSKLAYKERMARISIVSKISNIHES